MLNVVLYFKNIINNGNRAIVVCSFIFFLQRIKQLQNKPGIIQTKYLIIANCHTLSNLLLLFNLNIFFNPLKKFNK